MLQFVLVRALLCVLPEGGVAEPHPLEGQGGSVPEDALEEPGGAVVQEDDHGGVGGARDEAVDVVEGGVVRERGTPVVLVAGPPGTPRPAGPQSCFRSRALGQWKRKMADVVERAHGFKSTTYCCTHHTDERRWRPCL